MRMPSSTLRSLLAGLVVTGIAGAAAAGYLTIAAGAGSKWDNRKHGTPAVITWGFVPDGTTMAATFPLAPEVTGTSQLGALRSSLDATYGVGAFDAALQRALDTWELVAGVQFVGPVTDAGLPIGTATTPDIRIAAFAAVASSGFSYIGAVGYGPPGDDLNFPDPVAGDIVFNLSNAFSLFPGAEGTLKPDFTNDVEELFLHELGHAAMGLAHPASGPPEVMYVGPGCCTVINRVPSPDDIAGAKVVYGNSATPACQNGIDDDGDGLTDFPADPGCGGPPATRENPQCNDGINNDPEQDVLIDLADPECKGIAANALESGNCGLLGVEALLPLLAWRWVGARRRARSPARP